MKKYLILTIILIFGIFLSYKFIKFIEGIETPDLHYNTVYSENYDESRFNNSLIGLTKNQIINIFGKPLKVDTLKTFSNFLYKNENDSIFIDCNGGVDLSHFNLLHKKENFLLFTFDNNEKVTEVFKMKNSERINLDSLIGLSKNDIVKKYGPPNQISGINTDGILFNFSNLKEGGYTGKMPKIYLRKILFDKNNKAGKIIKKEGNPLDFTEGLCEKK